LIIIELTISNQCISKGAKEAISTLFRNKSGLMQNKTFYFALRCQGKKS